MRLIPTFSNSTWNIFVFFLLFFTPCRGLRAQAAAEYAGATSASAATATSAKTFTVGSPVATTGEKKSAHLTAPVGALPEAVNRQALERRAGQNACKLLVRSQPSAAGVWIDGAFVGSAPLLLVLPPGKFRLELRGTRSQYASQTVDLLPSETREVTVTLAVRYPTHATLR